MCWQKSLDSPPATHQTHHHLYKATEIWQALLSVMPHKLRLMASTRFNSLLLHSPLVLYFRRWWVIRGGPNAPTLFHFNQLAWLDLPLALLGHGKSTAVLSFACVCNQVLPIADLFAHLFGFSDSSRQVSGFQYIHFYSQGGETLAQVAQRGGRCPILGTILGQVGRGSEHPDLVGDVPAHGRGLDWMALKCPFPLKPGCDAMI